MNQSRLGIVSGMMRIFALREFSRCKSRARSSSALPHLSGPQTQTVGESSLAS